MQLILWFCRHPIFIAVKKIGDKRTIFAVARRFSHHFQQLRHPRHPPPVAVERNLTAGPMNQLLSVRVSRIASPGRHRSTITTDFPTAPGVRCERRSPPWKSLNLRFTHKNSKAPTTGPSPALRRRLSIDYSSLKTIGRPMSADRPGTVTLNADASQAASFSLGRRAGR